MYFIRDRDYYKEQLVSAVDRAVQVQSSLVLNPVMRAEGEGAD